MFIKNSQVATALCTLILFSCNRNPLKIDVSNVKIPPVTIMRLEKDMFSMPSDSIRKYTPFMEKKYGTFYADFVTGFVNNGGIIDSTYSAEILRFISDKDMRDTYDSCEKAFPAMDFLADGFNDAFRHYRYYFPDNPLPKVVTVMSGYLYSIIYYDSTLALCLEMYLGKNNGLYKFLTPAPPQYKLIHFTRDYLLVDGIYGWLESTYKPNEMRSDMLGQIIHEGKIMYLLDALLPDASDTLKIKYSSKQLKWCYGNEFNMWAYLIQNKLLYTNSQPEIAKFTDEGPFTEAFNHAYCPARVGYWFGWQIVRSYMKKNKNVSIPALLAERDVDKLLQQSGYKPSK